MKNHIHQGTLVGAVSRLGCRTAKQWYDRERAKTAFENRSDFPETTRYLFNRKLHTFTGLLKTKVRKVSSLKCVQTASIWQRMLAFEVPGS